VTSTNLVFISKNTNKGIKLFRCLYCNDNIKAHFLSETRCYFYCKICKCQFINQHDILVEIDIKTKINSKFYTVKLDLAKNRTNLVSGHIIYSCDECVLVTPQNINNKIRMWLLMQ